MRIAGQDGEVTMSDSIPRALPQDASLEQLRKQAKELKSSHPYAKLTEAQFALAQSYGFDSWPKLVFQVQQQELSRAIRDGDFARFEALLTETPRLATSAIGDGFTPLHLAAENDDPAMVKLLIEKAASLESRYHSGGHTPLSWAVTTWSFHAARQLIALGARPDLFCAAGLGLLSEVESFFADGGIQTGASITGSSRYDAAGQRLPCPPIDTADQVSDALYIACRCGQVEVARYLLERGADPNWRAFIGGTPLHWAEFSELELLTELLRSFGGSEDLRDHEFGATPRQFRGYLLTAWGFPVSRLAEWLDGHPEMLKTSTSAGSLLDVAVRASNQPAIALLRGRGIEDASADR